jgi:hypothetical protein
MTNLKIFLSLSLGAFLLLLLINIALPALLLLLQVPSFAIGNESFWLLRWNNTADGFGIQFNVLPLLVVAILVGLVGLLVKQRRH